MINQNELALLIDLGEKEYVVTIKSGLQFHSNKGFIAHDAIIGRPWGTIIYTNIGHPYLVVQPSTSDLIRHIKRSSQVIFPKDSAHILMKMNIKPGVHVLESGCGSGGLTLALATAVGPSGHVYSQEIRADFIALTSRNMQKVGLEAYVSFIHADGREGFQVPDKMDAVFLDMQQPESCLAQARAVLKDGGFFGSLVPTTNQIQEILRSMAAMQGDAQFGLIEVEEVFTRGYKTVADRLRPKDRMIAHTGYLIFARAVIKPPQQPTEGASDDHFEGEVPETDVQAFEESENS